MKNAWQQSIKDQLAEKLVHLSVDQVVPSDLGDDTVEIFAEIVEIGVHIRFTINSNEM